MAERGSGRAASGIVFEIGPARRETAMNARPVAGKTRPKMVDFFIAVVDAQVSGIRNSFKACRASRHMLEMHAGLSDFIQSRLCQWQTDCAPLNSGCVSKDNCAPRDLAFRSR